ALDVFHRLDGAHQDGAGIAILFGRGVEAVVHAVDQINVGDASFAVHERGATPRTAASVRGGVMRADVRLGLDDAAGAADALVVDVDKHLPKQVAGDGKRRSRVKIAVESNANGYSERPASCANKMASATSRMLLREFMLSRWMRRNASDSFKFCESMSTPLARSTSLRVSRISCVWAR